MTRASDGTAPELPVDAVATAAATASEAANVIDAAALDRALASVLPPASLFAVGGRVRDQLRSANDGIDRPAKDFDYLVTGVTLGDLVERLSRIGRTDVVGATFAVVKCTVGGVTVDVALPRRERSTGVGHRAFDVEFGPDIPLEDDLARRDFRMNMIARGIGDGALVDPYDGARDILAARIDLLRSEAFVEDSLRMLRAAQFAGRFAFAVSAATMTQMQASAHLIASVSPERVRDELLKLIVLAEQPARGFAVLVEGRLLPLVLPELAEGLGIEQNEFHRFDVFDHNIATLSAVPPGHTVDRLAALLHDVGKPRTKDGPHFYGHEHVGAGLTGSLLERLRIPAATAERVVRLVRNHMYSTEPEMNDAAIRRFIRRVGADAVDRQFSLRAADIVGSGLPKRSDANERFEARVHAELLRKPVLDVGALAVSGNDIIDELVRRGRLPQGSRGAPLVGIILRKLLERVVDDPERNRRDILLADVASEVAAAP